MRRRMRRPKLISLLNYQDSQYRMEEEETRWRMLELIPPIQVLTTLIQEGRGRGEEMGRKLELISLLNR